MLKIRKGDDSACRGHV